MSKCPRYEGTQIMVLALKDSSCEKLQNDSQVFKACFQLFHLATYLNIRGHKSKDTQLKMSPLKM